MNSIFRIAGAALVLATASACRPPEPSSPADGGDAQRLVALLDYVAGDYALAVTDGVVTSAPEYEEQLLFAADARRLGTALVGGVAGDPLLGRLAEVETRVRDRATPEQVARACRAARDEVVTRFRLATIPRRRPSLPAAQALYASSCASCHGATGEADTERARQLDPRPASFRDPQRLRDLSPYRVYNALTFGVRGTGMAAFDTLSEDERWSLAFYVFRLGHEGEAAAGPIALSLGDLASRSDRELLEALAGEAHGQPAAALAWARREAAFRELPAGVGIDHTRRLVRQAVESARRGRLSEADGLSLDAYLQGFEPLEPRLRARDPQGTFAVESAFRDLRAALARGDVAAAAARAGDLDARLRALGDGRRRVMPALAAFLIYFREGIEAALLVGALLAGLSRLGRPDARRAVHAGWLAAVPAGIATWWVFDRAIALGARHRELLEAVVALAAAGVLLSVSFWMISRADARRWMAYLQRQMERTVGRGNVAMLGGLAFLAVYREAAETVLFTQALLLDAGTSRLQVWAGAAAGLAAVAAVAVLMSRAVARLPLRPFFAVSGALLSSLAVSFAGAGMYALVSAGYIPPRPVRFPEVPWMGIHPDLTALLVQLAIVSAMATATLVALRRRPVAVTAPARDPAAAGGLPES